MSSGRCAHLCDRLCSFKRTSGDSEMGPLLTSSKQLILRMEKTKQNWRFEVIYSKPSS